MLVESMKYQFNEVDKNISQKVRYIKNKQFLSLADALECDYRQNALD